MNDDIAPVRLLRLINKNKKFDGLWRDVDEYRRHFKDKWPAWCFLPLSAWHTLVLNLEPRLIQNKDPIKIGLVNAWAAAMAAVGAWRPTQGIYVFDEEAFEAIGRSDIDSQIPVDHILHLPAWGVYIKWITDRYDGFFATLSYDLSDCKKYLDLVFLDDNNGGLPRPNPIKIPLQKTMSISEAIESLKLETLEALRENRTALALAEEYYDELRVDDTAIAITLLLYLCCGKPEIDGIQSVPSIYHPQETRVKRGWRLYPPDKPKVHIVAERIGYKLREYKTKNQISPTNKKMPPHIRGGHFTRYWYGPRKSPHRCYDYVWIPQLPINMLDDFDEL